jgi:hypothetical protein
LFAYGYTISKPEASKIPQLSKFCGWSSIAADLLFYRMWFCQYNRNGYLGVAIPQGYPDIQAGALERDIRVPDPFVAGAAAHPQPQIHR